MSASADGLADNEYAVIREIGRRPTHTQRSLSQSVGLSLGTTNLLVRRLARKGLIKVRQLDWKRAQYLLTLKGAVEKTQKTCRYTLYTMRLFRQIQENIATVLRREYEGGRRRFTFVAQDEILELLRETVRGLGCGDADFEFYEDFDRVPKSADLVLAATPETAPSPGPRRRYASLVDFDDISFRIR